jgi:PucR family transcriptional regulator, purine catabolism regulatory protein
LDILHRRTIVPVPTLTSLCAALGADLAPAPGFTVPSREVSAVHISELLDPTGYLNGGELLLTTGLSLPKSKLGCERYVRRLVGADLSALALGLGPVHASVPPALLTACERFELPLLTVPAPTPFLRITKTYWAAVSRSAEQQLKDVLATQRALVDAAASPDPVGSVLRTMSRALDAWAAMFGPSGDLEQVFPAGAEEEAEQIRQELVRLEGAGVHSAASFATDATAVIVFPLAVEDSVVGYLAVGTSAPLDPTRRRAVLTASALLSLDSARRSRAESVAEEAERCVGLLVDFGHVDAARQLATATHTASPGEYVRVLALRGRGSDVLTYAVRHWCPQALTVRTDRHSGWTLVPVDHPPIGPLDDALARVDPEATAVLSDIVPIEQLSRVRSVTTSMLSTLPSGTRLLLPPGAGPYDQDLATRLGHAVDALPTSLRDAVVSYLRHRGQWEPASRAIGVHRNTLRHRIARCEEALGVDLGDPDVSAELWLMLRRKGLA